MLRKVLAGLLVAIFVPLFIVFLVAISAKFTIVNPTYYPSQFEKLNIYEKISNELAPTIVQSLFITNGQNQTVQMDTDEITEIVKKVITPDKLKSAAETFFNSLNDYLKGTTNTLSGKIDLREIKKSFGDILEVTLKAQINNLADCKPEESTKTSQNENGIPSCIPSGSSKAQMISELKISDQNKEEFTNNIPDEFDLAIYFDPNKNPQNMRLLQSVKTASGYLNLSLTILSIVCIILLLLIGLLIWKPAYSLLKWLAIAIIIPSAIVLLSTIGLYLSIKTMTMGLAGGINLPTQAITALQQMAEALTGGVNFSLMIVSLVFIVVSISLFIIAAQLKKRYPHQEIYEKKK